MTSVLRRMPLPALVVSVIALCLPTVVAGQCPPPPTTSSLVEGHIGLFFDPLGTTSCGDLVVNVPTPVYVVARVPFGGVASFDIPVVEPNGSVAGIILGPTGLPAGSPYDVSVYADACSQGVRPDPMTCPVAQGDLIVIAEMTLTMFVPFSGTVCFHTGCPTIAGTVAGNPTFTTCDGVAGNFTGGTVMCLGFGEVPVSAQTSTWGAVKSLYRE